MREGGWQISTFFSPDHERVHSYVLLGKKVYLVRGLKCASAWHSLCSRFVEYVSTAVKSVLIQKCIFFSFVGVGDEGRW